MTNIAIGAVLVMCVNILSAQSIRKDYREMTQSERDAFISALYSLRSGSNLFGDLANYHATEMQDIHFNDAPRDVFLAWHRRQILELEHGMQGINPRLSIPYWHWPTDNSASSDLWSQDFLGQFNGPWNLNRQLRGSLPTQREIDNVQSISNFDNYTRTFERGNVHVAGHSWVGGTMSSMRSPNDPAFYLHHGMVDKLFQEWVEANNASASSDLYQRTDMPRYDGTYTFDGETLPSVDPDDIVDSRMFGVFYAENGRVNMNNYSVTNNDHDEETFYYQFRIDAGNNFTVPADRTATIESVNEIRLEPGFFAAPGSTFNALIDRDNNVDRVRMSLFADRVVNETQAYVYPNPAVDKILVQANGSFDHALVSVVSVSGKSVLSASLNSPSDEINVSCLKSGMYIVTINIEGQAPITTRFSKL